MCIICNCIYIDVLCEQLSMHLKINICAASYCHTICDSVRPLWQFTKAVKLSHKIFLGSMKQVCEPQDWLDRIISPMEGKMYIVWTSIFKSTYNILFLFALNSSHVLICTLPEI